MSQIYSRSNPFLAKIMERTPLCDSQAGKEVQHLVMDLKGSGITYDVGDCLAILPSNHPNRVKRLLTVLNLQENTLLDYIRAKEQISASEIFTKRLNVNNCPLDLIKKIAYATGNNKLKELSGDKEQVKKLDLIAFLEELGNIPLTSQEIVNCLRPIMPRFYSIASSMEAVGEEVHLTVALEQSFVNGTKRLGVCTDYLCRQTFLNQSEVPVYLHPHRGFTLPSDHKTPIIMVGPGTGIAPFRGFMQQRELGDQHAKHWLFFGDWTSERHYFYRDYWEGLSSKGMLKLDLAFSRDQDEKIYVQHRMQENGRELFQWLEEGAHFYVCGNASKMAKDVEQALHQVLENHGNLSEKDAKVYVKKMRTEKRYLRDVY